MLLATVAAVGLVGCRTNLDYVREHGCYERTLITPEKPTVQIIDGREFASETMKPFYAYVCPSGVHVYIDADEPQLPESKDQSITSTGNNNTNINSK